MDVPDSDSYLVKVIVEFFCHPLGKGGDKYPFIDFGPLADFFDQVVNLILDRSDLYRRIQEPGRPDDLFHDQPGRAFQLVVCRSGADVDFLPGDGIELVEGERPVVCRGRESEAIFDKHGLPGMVAAVHRPDLRNRHMALVDEGDEIVREIVYQAEWPLSGLPAVQVSRVVLDTGAVAHLLDHLQVILDPLPESLCFQSLADLLEVFKLLPEVVLDHAHCLDGPFPGGDEVRGREYRSLLQLLDVSPGDWVYHRQRVYLVAEEFDPQSFVRPSEEDIDCVPAYPEGATLEIDFRPGVIRVHKLVQQSCEAPLLTFFQGDRLGVEVLRVAYAVEAGDAGDNNDIPSPRHQRRGGA